MMEKAMRDLTAQEVDEISGGRSYQGRTTYRGGNFYPDRTTYQFRDMVVGAIAGGLMGGPVGFAIGLAAGAITGYRPH